MNGEKYVGLDVHQTTTIAAVRDAGGKLVMESVLETKSEVLLQGNRNDRVDTRKLSTPPRKDFSANGTNPLNFVSQPMGALHRSPYADRNLIERRQL